MIFDSLLKLDQSAEVTLWRCGAVEIKSACCLRSPFGKAALVANNYEMQCLVAILDADDVDNIRRKVTLSAVFVET
jgi:hypothetical protein